ncbi:dolichol phosphate-mannose biosynthesis regulatory [Gaertneriomyces semiglobifer]|nr:dolichol phosphate-mannose biosynthesis regulatory [Gaertneriomyces semiglobifer]
MANISDRIVGGFLILFSLAVFLYYSIWTLVLPFVDATHPIQNYFLAPEWAIRVPVILLIVGVSAIFGFISLVMIRSDRKKKQT